MGCTFDAFPLGASGSSIREESGKRSLVTHVTTHLATSHSSPSTAFCYMTSIIHILTKTLLSGVLHAMMSTLLCPHHPSLYDPPHCSS